MIKTQGHITHIYHSPSEEVCFILIQPLQTFEFLEGQFMMIGATWVARLGDNVGKKVSIKKPYSIASTNNQLQKNKELGFYIKKTSPYGLSGRLTTQAKVGDEVTLQGPLGHFYDSETYQNYLFISTGSGLSPNLGIFQHLVYEKQKFGKIAFVFGEKYHNNTIDEINNLITEHKHKNIYIARHLSQEKKDGRKEGRIQGSLQKAIDFLGNKDVNVFICGSPTMVDEVKKHLISQNFNNAQITLEKR